MTPDATSDRWRRIEEILDGALALDPARRDEYLDAACAGDADLRHEVASLIAAHERSGLVDRMAADLAPVAARVRESTASNTGPLKGRTFGQYQVIERVGGGGMGVVYKALDTRLGRTVALKFLQPRLTEDSSAAERFRLEARAVAALEHQNICTIHEIGETDDGQLFLAMPLYDGETLQDRIARGAVPVGEAVDIALQVARGLAKAHARGIIHRDIKPSNVLVTTDCVVKLLDFGIAKLADVTVTTAGPLGTVAYMSPEQARGEQVDHRTDVWSLGVVLYEMLAGQPPFTGSSAFVVANAIQHTAPAPVSTHRPDVPPELEHIAATALAASPDERYQSAQEFEAALAGLGVATGTSTGGSAPTRRAHRRRPLARRAAIAGSSLVMLASALWFGTRGRGAASAGAASVPATVAVLPFVDQSPGGNQEYFSEGITEELINTLARVGGLRVASRTSSFAFKGRNTDPRTIGTELGVATILEGSVKRDGDQLRITARLVNAKDGYALWSNTYDRTAGDAFAIQHEIAGAIAQTLRVKLVGPVADSSPGPPPNAAANDLYFKGRYAWYTRTQAGVRSAVQFFQQALDVDPTFVRAHAGLADAYAILGFYDYSAPTEVFPKAEASAKRAADLAPFLAGPRATLGYVALYHHWDLKRGEEEFQRAISLDPNYSTAHQWYANLLTAAGRFEEAEREMRLAQVIDPLSLIANAGLGWVLYYAGDHAGAAAQCHRTLELNATYGLAHLWRGWALQELDSLPAAVEAHRKALAVSDSSALYVAALARALALSGERGEAEALLRTLESRAASGQYVASYEIAKVHEALGHADVALQWLERARTQRAHSMVFLNVDPQLARLRGRPEFQKLVKQVFPG